MMFGLGLGGLGLGCMAGAVQISVALSGVTLNPFSATVTPQSGYAIVAGSASIVVPAKPGSYGTAQTVSATVTGGSTGTITETTAGSVVAALILAGWLDGETPTISATVGVAVSSGLPTTGLTALYDASQLASLYQDSAGTTPVTAAGQSVGLMLDTARGLVLGTELVTNGTFDVDTTGWSAGPGASIGRNTDIFSSGGLRVTANGAASSYAVYTVTGLTVGSHYVLSASVYTPSANAANNRATIGVQGALFTTAGSRAQVPLDTVETISIRFVASGISQIIYMSVVNSDFSSWGTSGSVGYFGNISVREIPGYHARQATAAKRPTYQTGPARLIDDNFDDVLPVALTGTYSVYRAVSGALAYTEGVVMSGSYDILVNNLSRCAIYNRALTASERAALAGYWGVTA